MTDRIWEQISTSELDFELDFELDLELKIELDMW